jgi:hypothetical protein
MSNMNYTTHKDIIERIKREGFENVEETDVKEYIWEILGYLATPKLFETVEVELEVENYRAELPMDFYSLEAIRDKDSKIMYRKSTDIFHRLSRANSGTGGITDAYTPVVYPSPEPEFPDPQAYSLIMNIPERRDPLEHVYMMERNVIFIPFEDATLQVVYKAFPIFDDGTPKVPDDPKVIRAVVSYVCEKIAMKMMLRGELTPQIYTILAQKLAWAKASARSSLLMNSPAEMESFKNRMLAIVPKLNSFKDGYKFMGEE